MYPPFMLAKVKNILNIVTLACPSPSVLSRWQSYVSMYFVFGAVSSKGGRGGPLRGPRARGCGCLWGKAEGGRASSEPAGGGVRNRLEFSLLLSLCQDKESKKESLVKESKWMRRIIFKCPETFL